MCLPLARRNWPLPGLITALDLATYYTYPVYSPIWGPFNAGGVDHAVYVRFAVLAALAGWLVWQDRGRIPTGSALRSAKKALPQAYGYRGREGGRFVRRRGRIPKVYP